MRRQAIPAVLALLILLPATASFSQQAKESTRPASFASSNQLAKGTLSGKILGPDDRPVAGARVWIETYDSKPVAETVSGNDGRFRLGPMDPIYRHRFDLLVEAEGLARQYVSGGTFSIFPGADNDLGTTRLESGCRLTGILLDVDGKPKEGIAVNCQVNRYPGAHSYQPIGPSWKVATDADGKLRTPPLPVGVLYVTVRIPERRVAWRLHKIGPNAEDRLDPIRMENDVPITGTVEDDQKHPVAGGAIHASDVAQTTSDSAGKFTLRGFGPSPFFQMQIRKDGYLIVDRGVTVAEDGYRWFDVGGNHKSHGPFKNLQVVMKPSVWIVGQAIDADTGKPVRVDKVVSCLFDRMRDGEIVRHG